jgi:hypothetical protein
MILFTCKIPKRCPAGESTSMPCHVIVDDGASPESCPYGSWSGVKNPKWIKREISGVLFEKDKL